MSRPGSQRPEGHLTVQEAADRVGLNTAYTRRLAKAGKFGPVVKGPWRVWIARAGVEAYLAQQGVSA